MDIPAPAPFTVQFGKTARVIEYRDDSGCIEFTFDVGSTKNSLVLEHYPASMKRPPHYDTAFVRTKQFMTSCGYQVDEFGAARPPN